MPRPLKPATRQALRAYLGCFFFVFLAVAYLLGFTWYITNDAATTTPTTDANFIDGYLQGLYIVFTWLYSLADDTTAIYQAPGNGWYDLGYILGISTLASFGKSSPRRR